MLQINLTFDNPKFFFCFCCAPVVTLKVLGSLTRRQRVTQLVREFGQPQSRRNNGEKREEAGMKGRVRESASGEIRENASEKNGLS